MSLSIETLALAKKYAGGGGSGGSDIQIDTTLTKSGYAADAKATGDALNSLGSSLGQQISSVGSGLGNSIGQLSQSVNTRINQVENNTAVAFNEANSYAPGTYVIQNDKLWLLPEGHSSNITWANTTKIELRLADSVAMKAAAIAEVFDESKAYAEGTYVWHGDNLYRISADHRSGIAWSSTAYQQIKLSDYVVPRNVIAFEYGEDVSSAQPKSYVWHDNKLYRLPNGMSGNWNSADATQVRLTDCISNHDMVQNITVGDAAYNRAMTADKSYAIGDYILARGTLYKAIANITIGGTLTPGTNVEATDIVTEIGLAAEIVSAVTGTDPVITAEANRRYICGEVATLTITPPNSGTCDVRFTSGITPTALTIPNTVKFPGWFNPASLMASTIYEINISDGLAAVMMWDA